MSAPKIIYITPAPEGGFVEFWAEHPSAARGDVAYIPQKGATKMQAEIDALKAELAALKAPPKVLSAEEVKETGAYWWKKIGADDFDEPVQVFEDEHYITHDPILIISRIGCVGGISQERWKGQFIGPIKMPEV